MTATTQKPDYDKLFAELIAFTRDTMERCHIPGVSIGLIAGGKDYAVGLGVTSITNPLPVTPETLFQIGSTTKTFTATAIMRLLEEGKLSLDDRVRKYLPDFKVTDESVAQNVTICHLLTHTPGWLGDFFPETGYGDDAIAAYVRRMCEVPQKTPLGAFYSYNNAALVVAGRVIEVITGKTYEAAIRELIFKPLQMTNSFFFPGEVMLRRFAAGHWLDGDKAIVADPWPIIRGGNPAGGISSDAYDQIRFMRFHMGDGTTPDGDRLLTRESMKLMQSPLVPMGDGDSVGLTWTVEDMDGVRFISHGGTTNGQESDFWIAPREGVALTVMTNLDRGDQLHKALRQWVREQYLGIQPKAPPTTIEYPANELACYTAIYLTSTGDFLEVSPNQCGLQITHILASNPGQDAPRGEALPPMRAKFFAPDKCLILDPPFENARCEFLRQPDGDISWLRISGRILSRCK